MTNFNNLIGVINLPASLLENTKSSKMSSFIKNNSNQIYLITEEKIPDDFSSFTSFYNLTNNDFFQIIFQLIEFSEQGQTSTIIFKESIVENLKIVNPPDTLRLTCSQRKILNEFTKISLMMCDKVFLYFYRSSKNKMIELLENCSDLDLKNKFTEIINRPLNDSRENQIKIKYPTYAQYHDDHHWLTSMLLREIYNDKNFDHRRILSFLKDGDRISKKIEIHINQAFSGDIEIAVKGLSEAMTSIREFTSFIRKTLIK